MAHEFSELASATEQRKGGGAYAPRNATDQSARESVAPGGSGKGGYGFEAADEAVTPSSVSARAETVALGGGVDAATGEVDGGSIPSRGTVRRNGAEHNANTLVGPPVREAGGPQPNYASDCLDAYDALCAARGAELSRAACEERGRPLSSIVDTVRPDALRKHETLPCRPRSKGRRS